MSHWTFIKGVPHVVPGAQADDGVLIDGALVDGTHITSDSVVSGDITLTPALVNAYAGHLYDATHLYGGLLRAEAGSVTINGDAPGTAYLYVTSGDANLRGGNVTISGNADELVADAGPVTVRGGAAVASDGGTPFRVAGGDATLAGGAASGPVPDDAAGGSVVATGGQNGTGGDVIVTAGHGTAGQGAFSVVTGLGQRVIAVSNSGADKRLGLFGTDGVTQHGAIADAAGGAVVDAEARAALNTLLAYLRARGDIAT